MGSNPAGPICRAGATAFPRIPAFEGPIRVTPSWRTPAFAMALAALPIIATAQQRDAGAVGDTVPPSAPFGGMSDSPISTTTVLHARLAPANDFGAILVYAIAVRGPPGWYNHPTSERAIPADSLPAGTTGERWHVGDRVYQFCYNRTDSAVTVLGRSFDLRAGRLLLLTLGPTASDSATASQVPLLVYRLPHPEVFAPGFVRAVQELRAFAGIDSATRSRQSPSKAPTARQTIK